MKQPIILTGMYHSGTSLLSRMLERSGVFMGADQNGNAESVFFQKLNHWILSQAGATWDNPYNFQFISDRFSDAIQKALERQLKRRHIKKFLGPDLKRYKSYDSFDFDWGWNDPQNTFSLDVWTSLFSKPKIVHVYRNPVDVVAQLKHHALAIRDERRKKLFTGMRRRRLENNLSSERLYEESFRTLHLEEGYKLWTQYVSKAQVLQESCECEVYQLCYEDLLLKGDSEIKDLFEFLEFKLPDGIIRELKEMIHGLEVYPFLRDQKLNEFYQIIRNQSQVVEMNYHNIK